MCLFRSLATFCRGGLAKESVHKNALEITKRPFFGCPMVTEPPRIRERPRGVENSGGGETYRKFGEKPLPKNVFGPPTYDTFSPPLFWRLSVISLKRKRHRPDQPQFLRPPKVVLESTLCSTFSPPQIHAIRFAPPSAAAQTKTPTLGENVHERVWSYFIWSVFICSVPQPV